MDDRRIIDLYFSRSESAIQETQAKYAKPCRGIALNILGDELKAEECVNHVYWSLWNAIPPQRPDSLAAFICKVARNISLKRERFDHAAKRSARAVVSLSELENALPDSSLPSMEEEQLGKRISAFLRTEKPDARNVFIRKYWFFDTVSAIADRYSFSESKVKSMLYHTRKRLRDYLNKEGVYL